MGPLHTEQARIQREDEKDRQRRRRERILMIIIFIAFIGTTLLGVKLGKDPGGGPVVNSVLFFALLNLNVILVILLVFLVFRNLVKLFLERRSKAFGSHLKTKLVIGFVSFSLFPTIIMFVIATVYINNSFDKWFSYRVSKSIRGSLKVVNAFYQNMTDLGFHFGEEIGRDIKEGNLLDQSRKNDLVLHLEKAREKFSLDGIELFLGQKDEANFSTLAPKYSGLPLPRPGQHLLDQAFLGNRVSDLSKVAKGDMIRCIVPIFDSASTEKPKAVLVASYYVPHHLVSKIERIVELFREYKEADSMKFPVRSAYVILLLMISLLVAFVATWLGFYLAKQLTIPLEMLVQGTQEVASGNYDVQLEAQGFAEFVSLTNAFNTMTKDLKESNQQLKQGNIELEQRRQYMETVLKHVTTGVVSVDSNGRVTTVNKFAEEFFGVSPGSLIGKDYKDLLPVKEREKILRLVRILESSGVAIERQLQVKIKGALLTLIVTLTSLVDESGHPLGVLVVFDDLTELEKAQRMAAWQEVARRIAHEIKNPLTPIKLSAQRLKKRFAGQIKAGQDIFEDCTTTIIKQVDEMRDLVNEFSTFARLPESNPSPNNVGEIVHEAMLLFQEAHKNIRFQYEEKTAIPTLSLDREQIKRVFINLFDNAVFAMNGKGEIRIIADYVRALQMISVEVTDTGPGIQENIKSRLFEPYFSTKEGGTGLGLSIVKRIISDHHGFIRVVSQPPQGTTFIIELPLLASLDIPLRGSRRGHNVGAEHAQG